MHGSCPLRAVLLAACCALAPLSQAQTRPPETAPPVPAHPAGKFLPGVYRGQLGKSQIEMVLRLQTDAEDSVEGSYFVFGEGQTVEVVGEFEDDRFSLEESRNGTDVSGTWEGRIEGGRISGSWADGDERVHLPFTIERVAAVPNP